MKLCRGYGFLLLASLTLLLLGSCSSPNKKVQFYHWKLNAESNALVQNALDEAGTDKIYLHYFDVVQDEGSESHPEYVLREVDELYQDFEITPVVYIENDVISEIYSVRSLAQRINELVHQISEHHFETKFERLQIDCDWTQSTREKYFELITLLEDSFMVDVTIRLHQIKYQQAVGIPPSTSGTLMLYNMGDLKNPHENSIINRGIVSSYIDENTSYPMPLNIALPIFHQAVVYNNESAIRLIPKLTKAELEAAPDYFEAVSDYVFTLKRDTLFKGHFLSPGFQIKIEESPLEEIISSYWVAKNSKLAFREIILYHLDEDQLKHIHLKDLLKEL